MCGFFEPRNRVFQKIDSTLINDDTKSKNNQHFFCHVYKNVIGTNLIDIW